MSINRNNGYVDIKNKINAYKTTIKTQENEKIIRRESLGDNLSKDSNDITQQLSLNNQQTNLLSQFDNLIDIFRTLSFNDGSQNGIDFLLTELFSSNKSFKNKIISTFTDEVINSIGCSEESIYTPDIKFYIRVDQIDFFGKLKKNPDESPNDLLYEKFSTPNGAIPYSMDRELYNRLQNESVSFSDEYGSSFIGNNNNELFDIKYVTQYTENGTTFFGDFYEITTKNRVSGNRITDFIVDYFNSIEIFTTKNLYVNLINNLTNIIDISGNISIDEKENVSRLDKIITRILGLCFDDTEEIDVSGISKISEIDKIDENFFELNSVDLRQIEDEINRIKLGITTFQDCSTVNIPIRESNILEIIRNVINSDDDITENILDSINDITNNEEWERDLGLGVNFNLNVKINILKIIPKTLVMSLLTPKALLGIMIANKMVGNDSINLVNGITSFLRVFPRYVVELTSKIGAIFVEIIFDLIRKNIKQIVNVLIFQIIREAKDRRTAIVLSVVTALKQLSSLIKDYRQCKSIIEQLLNLLNLGLSQLNLGLPMFTLAGTSLLSGYSPTRALTNITEEFEKLGLPTGDLPDGRPNVMLPAISSQIKGQYLEQIENGKTEIFIPPLTVVALGGGTTLPAKATGKTY